jgi:hypothetical protein
VNLDTHPLRPQIRLLLTTALALFVFTVVVGILNGTDVVDFERKVLLTHVHVGTLGWITLSVFASTLWLFGAGETPPGFRSSWPRVGAPLGAATITLYAIAFLTTENWARPIIGTVTAIAILGFFAWAVIQGRTMPMSVPRWGFLYALATSVTGGVLGVLYGILLASDIKALPDGGEDAHPATMVVGFLVPVGMALAEWGLRPDSVDTKATRPGFWQMTLLFLGGFTLMLGILLDVVPLITLNLPFSIAATVMFIGRNWSAFPKVGWGERQPAPFFLATTMAIVINLGMLTYLISKYAEDFDLTPTRLLLALDHVMFIGVMTNSIFGLMRIATDGARSAVAPWADRVVFWAMNAGLVAFWIGLVADTPWPKRLGTPVMGTAILLGVGVYLTRMSRTASAPIANSTP